VKEGEKIVVGPSKTLLFLLDGEKVSAAPAKPAAARPQPAAK
jgi:hypothetical protein